MKPIYFACIAIIFIAIASCTNQTPQPAPQPINNVKEEHKGPMDATEAHLGEHMGHMQYYMLKLGLALQNKNIPLAKFYVQEVNETADELAGMNIIDEQFEISNLLKSLLLPQVKLLAHQLDSDSADGLYDRYKNIISNCNSCHAATKHEFIVIEEPTQQFNGQNFKPKGIAP